MANIDHLSIFRRGAIEWNQWRANSNERPDLQDADLSAVEINRVDLSGCDCRGADFDNSTMAKSDLRRADFSGATFRGAFMNGSLLDGALFDEAILDKAEMRWCRSIDRTETSSATRRATSFHDASLQHAFMDDVLFMNTDFSGANFRAANLQSATFIGARFVDARFDGAVFGRTVLTACDLRRTLGLESCEHRSASTLDLETLRLAHGDLNAIFLSQAGLSEWEIELTHLYNPSLNEARVNDLTYAIFAQRTARPVQKRHVFLSYAWKDSEFVDALGRLLDNVHIKYWRDAHDMLAGPIEEQIDVAVALSTAVVVVLSIESVQSDWVEWEVSRAHDIARESHRHILCPVALDSTWRRASWSPVLRRQLEKYYVMDFSGWRDESTRIAQFRRLVAGLDAHYIAGAAESRRPTR